MVTPQHRLTEPRELRALAHPVRMAIIEQLSVAGPLTATELADRLDETPANCSWHLRKLAEFSFVEEAEGGKGRQRPWQMAGIGFTFSDRDGTASAESRQAAQAWGDVAMGRALDRLREADRRAADEPLEWRAATTSSETMAWLTAAELAEINSAVFALMSQYDERLEDAEARPPGSRLCEFVTWGVPTYFAGVEETK